MDYQVKLNSGVGNPWRWDESVSLLPPGQHIEHSSGIGDDWFWPYITDFDDDGRFDAAAGRHHASLGPGAGTCTRKNRLCPGQKRRAAELACCKGYHRNMTEKNLTLWKEMQDGFLRATMPGAGDA